MRNQKLLLLILLVDIVILIISYCFPDDIIGGFK